jgi:quercetin dioxygenase-like cupin family protein
MPHLNEIRKKTLTAGIDGQYVHGVNMTAGWVSIKAGSDLSVHQHPHEQITIMLEGKLEMQIGEELVMLEPGVIQVIPSNTPHGAKALTDCVLIDVFNPVREDYR